jgi:hypothetical protein
VRTGGIRVTTHVEEKPVSEQVKLRDEKAVVLFATCLALLRWRMRAH